jgi:hypothetical protein
MAAPASIPTSKEAEELLYHHPSQFYSPPPYEAAAYPKPSRRRVLLRKASVPVKVLLAAAFTIAVSGFCLLLERHARARQDSPYAKLSSIRLGRFEQSLRDCAIIRTSAQNLDPESRDVNPRWNEKRGQKGTITLRNATLFDGESFVSGPVDITFEKGLVVSISATSAANVHEGTVYDVHGRYVTPGLVDMHSHHSISTWPSLGMTDDTNEMNPEFGPLTPFVRVLDGLKAYDIGMTHIMSGGITSSLLLPGSANIMGGEGIPVKNALYSGELGDGEPVVEEMLLEHGVPLAERHRYLKMAFGENPKRVYTHTRTANAFIFRRQLSRAKELLTKQDEYCEIANALATASTHEKSRFIEKMGNLPIDLELESTVGLLRGRVALQNHNYLPEDMETMLRISEEFGFRVWAFHHAIEAWQVPEMLKTQGQ